MLKICKVMGSGDSKQKMCTATGIFNFDTPHRVVLSFAYLFRLNFCHLGYFVSNSSF